MNLKKIIYIAVFVGFIGLIAWRIVTNKEQSTKKPDNNKFLVVNGIVASTQIFENNLSISGSIEANEEVEIRSEVSGIIEEIYFKEGTHVEKGTVLFKVNDIELKAQLNQAITKEDLSKENERRAKLLLEKEAISKEDYDISLSDYKTAQSQSQLIKAQISKTSIKAPFSGKIGLRNVSLGTYITPTILVTKLINLGNLKITFSVPEKYASQVKLNSNISFQVAGSDNKYYAKIYAIESEIDIATRTLKVRAIAKNSHENILPGNFANVQLPLESIKNAVLVPTEAIVPVQSGKIVFVSKNGKAKQMSVETSTRTDNSILILSGLKAGDTLITSGVMTLKDDLPVKVKIQG